jgi:V8-like Glu-specific endopeptidase
MPRLIHTVTAVAALLLIQPPTVTSYAQAQTETVASQLANEYRTATVYIVVRGTSSDGQAVVKSGTGFMISDDGYALTSAHLFQENDRPLVKIRTVGSLGSSFDLEIPTGTILPAETTRTNGEIDIALIKFPPRPTPYKFVHFCKTSTSNEGAKIHALGFPLGQPLSINSGTLASKQGPRGLWKTDILVYEGSSGGPVFDETGHVIAVIKGGLSEAPGNNFMVPTNLFRDLISAGNGTMDECAGAAKIAVASCPPKVVVYDLNLEKSDHPTFNPDSRGFAQTFKALPGFTIDTFQFVSESQSNASPPDFVLSGDKTNLTVRTNVTSGPFFDQWRGWISGKIITNQKQNCAP